MIWAGPLFGVRPIVYSVICPLYGSIRPIALAPNGNPSAMPPNSVNQRAPSGPAVIPVGTPAWESPTVYRVIAPEGVTRSIDPLRFESEPTSVNQRLPSGPCVIPAVMLTGVEPPNSLMRVASKRRALEVFDLRAEARTVEVGRTRAVG